MGQGICPWITLSVTVERLNLHKLFIVPTIFINDAVQIPAKCYKGNVRYAAHLRLSLSFFNARARARAFLTIEITVSSGG